MKTAEEWFREQVSKESEFDRLQSDEQRIAMVVAFYKQIQLDALKEAANKCDEVKSEPGVSGMSPQAIVCDVCKAAILSAAEQLTRQCGRNANKRRYYNNK